MDNSFKSQISFLFGTVLLLIISISWLDLITELRIKLKIFKDSLVSQIFYTIFITVLTMIFVYIFNPFKSDVKNPEGIERARIEERIVTERLPILAA